MKTIIAEKPSVAREIARIVGALENGTVIDHIPSDKVFTVVSLLDLQNTDGNITIGNNFGS